MYTQEGVGQQQAYIESVWYSTHARVERNSFRILAGKAFFLKKNEVTLRDGCLQPLSRCLERQEVSIGCFIVYTKNIPV